MQAVAVLGQAGAVVGPLHRRLALAGDAVDDREVELVDVGVEVEEQVLDLVDDLGDAGVGTVDLVDHEDHRQLGLERLAQHEAGLGERALGGVDEQQHAVDHRQRPLDLAAEVGVARGVDDVDLHVAVRGLVLTAVFLARIVMPFSRSRSMESMTRSLTSWLARNAPDCQSILSTRVVLPWSTWATMATLRRSARVFNSGFLTIVERGLQGDHQRTGWITRPLGAAPRVPGTPSRRWNGAGPGGQAGTAVTITLLR